MIWKQPCAYARLRAKAGEARDLIDFAVEVTNELFDHTQPAAATAAAAALQLQVCYQQLSKEAFHRELLEQAALRFALLYVALGDYSAAHGLMAGRLFRPSQSCRPFSNLSRLALRRLPSGHTLRSHGAVGLHSWPSAEVGEALQKQWGSLCLTVLLHSTMCRSSEVDSNMENMSFLLPVNIP